MSSKFKQTVILMNEFLGQIYLGKNEITRDTIADMVLILERHIEDFRVINRTIFNLYDILVIMFLSVLSGYSNASAFSHYCDRNYKFLEMLGLLSDEIIPSHDTFRRVLMFLDPTFLENALNYILNKFFDKVEKHLDDEGQLTHMAIDGKELRGTGRSKNTKNPLKNIQTLNIYNVTRGICLFSKPINEKTNEIPVAQEILSTMNLKNVLITADAMHTQTMTSEIIVNKKGYYLFNVKDNQQSLRETIINRFEKQKKVTSLSINDEKTKKERFFYFYKISSMEIEDDFINKKYYVKYINGVDSEPLYFVTNLSDLNLIAEGVVKRWEIENDLHRNKDILLHEDNIRYTNRNVTGNLVVFNNFALAFIKIFKDLFNIERVKYARIDLTNSKADILKTIKLISKNRIKFEYKTNKVEK